MRNGCLWAAGLLLACSSLAAAQESAPAKTEAGKAVAQPTPVLPEVKTEAGKPGTGPKAGTGSAAPSPGLATTSSAPGPVTCCWPCCTERGPRVTAQVDYLLWWVRSGGVSSPLVTTSTSLTDVPPGALGQPGTRGAVGCPSRYCTFSGLRFGAAVALAP